jgi:uncharacterized ferredoxin-like protein
MLDPTIDQMQVAHHLVELFSQVAATMELLAFRRDQDFLQKEKDARVLFFSEKRVLYA